MRRTLLFLSTVAVAFALLAFVTPQGLSAQAQGTIRGTVSNAQTGEPIAGAQVSIRGTGLGMITNNEGVYILTNVPAGRLEVRVEFIGLAAGAQTVEVAPGQTVTVDFQMGIAAIELEGLVATGYATQTRREVSSAISTVSSMDLENPTVASLDAVLLGKAPGVEVIQNAGNPGNGITVRVRGYSSISASNQPLYVVDGMPIYREDFGQLGFGGQDLSAITGLSPDEIESVDVLKDAAAAAIYGSRGSNGVVMITTKRGATSEGAGGLGAPTFQINTSWGQQEASKKLDLFNTQEWMDYFRVAMLNDGYTEADVQSEFDYYGISSAVDTDWQDELLRTAPISNTQISMSGGTGRFNYLVSGSYFDQDGIVLGSSYNRANGRVNLDFQATDKLQISSSVAIAQEVNNRIVSDNSIYAVVTNYIANEPWARVYNDDGSYSGDASYSNPVGHAREDDAEARTFRSFGTINADYSLLPWLRLNGRVGFDVLNLRENEYNSPLVPWTYAAGADGLATLATSQGRKYLMEGFFTADRYYGNHEFSVTGGGSLETNDQELSYLFAEGFTSPDLTLPTNASEVTDFDGTVWENNLISAFGRLTYNWGERLVVNASIRTDGSSRFGPDNKWGTFPSASVAWIVSNESFMQDLAFISDLKVRGSWGETGNEAIGDYQYLGLYGTSNYGTIPGTAPSNLPNPELKWETTQEWNIGFDGSFFSDRLGIVAEIYNKETDDLLLNRPVTSTSGFTSVLANVGTIENRGWELGIRTVNFRSSDPNGLEWTSNLNLTHNENEVTKLYSSTPGEPGEPFSSGFKNRVEEGRALGEFYDYRYEGVDDQGNAQYTDLDENGDIIGTTLSPSSEDRMFVGTPHPDYYGGLRNTLSWRGFDLSGFLQFSFGAQIYNGMRWYADDGGYFFDNKFGDVDDDYWSEENPNGSQPRPSYFGTSGARYESSRFIEDADYVRLGEVSLGYRLPAAWISRFGASSGRLYVSGKNL
ncbi:MAG: TonB-dependent receptor, partial [Gemmatimonadota bacterium]